MPESKQVRYFSQWDLQSSDTNPQASPSGFYISVFSILNPIDPLASVSNLYLDPNCNKYCYLIDQEQVSISHINLYNKPIDFTYKPVKLWLGLLLGSSLYIKPMGIVARI